MMGDLDSMVSDLASELGFSGEGEGNAESVVGVPTSAESDTPAADAVGEPAEAPAAEAAPPAATIPAAPKTWRPDAVTHWEALPEQVRVEVLKREEDMYRGIEQYKAQAESSASLMKAVEPYLPQMRQFNVQPAEAVGRLLKAHDMLINGSPLEKMSVFRQVAQDYGVDLAGFGSLPEGEDDPRLVALSNELKQTRGVLNELLQGQATAATRDAERVLSSFVAEVGEDGQPLHPYFNDVADDIVGLLNSGIAKDLSDAYNRAVWTNPVTREKEIARMAEVKAAKAKADAAVAEEARNRAAAAKVRTSAKAATAGSPLGSMDDTLNETLREIQSRGG
jgi:hypothetical protein